MPFLGVDSWRWQYFENEPCPRNVVVPIDDATAWQLFPDFHHIHSKLFVSQSQGLPNGPHGVTPTRFPVFSKPVFNLRGMGTGSRVLHNLREYRAALQPGHMWVKLLKGQHISTDVALARGRPCWWRHTTAKPGPKGTFDYWTIHAARRPRLERYIGGWIARHLQGFTGIANFETIGGCIIECHLRMSEQWLDINGVGWLGAVVQLYSKGIWRFADPNRRTGYSVVLFGKHGVDWRIDRNAVRRFLDRPGISSIQITFDTKKPPAQHAMPPGGFRLAIVNCWDLAAGKRVRTELRRLFHPA
jgi:hypothetical protein